MKKALSKQYIRKNKNNFYKALLNLFLYIPICYSADHNLTSSPSGTLSLYNPTESIGRIVEIEKIKKISF